MNKEGARKQVEEDLRNYPYWMLGEYASGLGSSTRWDKIVGEKGYNKGSSVEYGYAQDEKIYTKIKIIEAVLDKLDEDSKKIIEEKYFRDRGDFNMDAILIELAISKNKFYNLRNKALDKFAIALRYSL